MSAQADRRRRSFVGFTLVELLVVIGIIAILISVLLPVLGSARKSANAVKCATALKEIGNAFKLYSIDYKNAYPVLKFDRGTSGNAVVLYTTPNGTQIKALYWSDLLAPYVTKNQGLNWGGQGANNGSGFALAQTSLFWACPEWTGRLSATAAFQGANGQSVFDNGYSMNPYRNWRPETPLGTQPPSSGWAMDAPATNGVGVWPRLTDYSAQRCLVEEATLWLPFMGGTDNSHKVLPELNWSNSSFGNRADTNGTEPAGYNLMDRYRHGKYPPMLSDGITYDDKRGLVKYNMLFGDGHVATLNTIGEGVRAIQMRDP